jgi:AcrR family transcriptional regulator
VTSVSDGAAPGGAAPGAARMSGQDRRRHLCAVARGLFVAAGYRGTTTAAVAEASGVSEALIMKHFGTKEALFREAIAEPVVAILEDAVAANWEQVTRAGVGEASDHVGRLTEFGIGWAGIIREHGPLLLALLRESAEFPHVVAQGGGMVTADVEQVAESLRALTAGPEYVELDARVLTYAGLAAMSIAGVVAEDIPSYMEKFVPMILFGVLSPAGRAEVGSSR